MVEVMSIIYTDSSLIEKHTNKVLGLTWSYIERIPLYHFYPGYTVLKAWITGCPLKCDVCLDSALKVPIDSIDLKSIDKKTISDILRRIKTSFIFFHGGECLLHWRWLKNLIIELKDEGILTGVKTSCLVENSIIADAAKLLDTILIELTPNLPEKLCELVRFNLKTVERLEPHLEVLLLINKVVHQKSLSTILDLLNDLNKNIPILIYPLIEQQYAHLSNLRKILINTGFNYVYIIDDPFYKFEHTYCPKCKNIVIERHQRTLRRCLLRGSVCPICGYTINIKGTCKTLQRKISLLLTEEPIL